MKRLITAIIAFLLLASFGAAFADAPDIEKTDYEGKGYVDVDFYGRVQYRKVKIRVWNEDGNRCTASITKKDSDDLTFKVSGIEPGEKYSYRISGVRQRGTAGYGSVSGAFSVPAVKSVVISDVSCDFEDNEIDIEFRRNVKYKSLKVTVKNASGKSLRTRVLDKDSDSIEAYVKGLKAGEKYTVTVSGVRPSGGNGKYQKVSYSFTARDD